MKITFGQNVVMDLDALKVAVLQAVVEKAKTRGVSLPPLHEVVLSSKLHLLDAQGQTVAVDRIVVTLEDA